LFPSFKPPPVLTECDGEGDEGTRVFPLHRFITEKTPSRFGSYDYTRNCYIDPRFAPPSRVRSNTHTPLPLPVL
jgi:hypothetical protein